MNTNNTRRSLRALVPVALFAAVLAFPAVATAAEKEWDVMAYGDCAGAADDLWGEGKVTKKQYQELLDGCCITSGGIVDRAVEDGCRSPGVDGQAVINPQNLHPLTPDRPSPPPVIITQNIGPA